MITRASCGRSAVPKTTTIGYGIVQEATHDCSHAKGNGLLGRAGVDIVRRMVIVTSSPPMRT